jgi:hypothetical protein
MSPTAIVTRHLATFLSGPKNEFTLVAAKHRALPVYSDINGSLLITPSLEVIALNNAGNLLPPSEQSGRSRLVALVSAAERYPDLQCLLPTRPEDASQCHVCEGRGWLLQPDMRCGECYVLGWQALHSNSNLAAEPGTSG